MRSDLVVLCYHGISDSWPDDTAVMPAAFAAEVRGFVDRGYRGATFTEAVEKVPAGRTVVVTFDDAATSVLRHAKPVLDELGLPGTVFVPTDYPDSGRPMSWAGLDRWVGGEFEAELECIGWEELRGLADAGWEIGSHTCSHPHLEDLDDATLERELRESKLRCEEALDRSCTSIAYPYGNGDPRVAAATGATGYAAAATVPVTSAAPSPLLWPRVGAYRRDDARRVWLRSRRRRLGLIPVLGRAMR
jgi:peptidoglycan/xylan/chitin deacetylase (PgdA/CDA1 family)